MGAKNKKRMVVAKNKTMVAKIWNGCSKKALPKMWILAKKCCCFQQKQKPVVAKRLPIAAPAEADSSISFAHARRNRRPITRWRTAHVGAARGQVEAAAR